MIPDRLIPQYRTRGLLDIEPYAVEHQQPASYDVHLGNTGMRSPVAAGHASILDLAESSPQMHAFEIPQRDYPHKLVLFPGQFMLAATQEYISLSARVAAELMGKSTLGRVGLAVHVTAGLIDPGWEGRITVELCNLGPWALRLWAGMPIGQLVFTDLEVNVVRPYGHVDLRSAYQGDRTVRGSKGFHERK